MKAKISEILEIFENFKEVTVVDFEEKDFSLIKCFSEDSYKIRTSEKTTIAFSIEHIKKYYGIEDDIDYVIKLKTEK